MSVPGWVGSAPPLVGEVQLGRVVLGGLPEGLQDVLLGPVGLVQMSVADGCLMVTAVDPDLASILHAAVDVHLEDGVVVEVLEVIHRLVHDVLDHVLDDRRRVQLKNN